MSLPSMPWKRIFEAAPGGIVIVDRAGRILAANAQAESMFGYAPKELLDKPVHVLVPERSRQRHERDCARYFASSQAMPVRRVQTEIKGRRRDGSQFAADISLSRVQTEKGPIALTFIQDITDRKRIEAALGVRARQQETVAQLGQHALAGTTLSTLMEQAVASVAETLGLEYCKILELLPDGKALLLRAGVGWKEGLVGRATVGTETDSQAGYTLLSDTPVIVEDLRGEARFTGPPLLFEHGVVSGMSVIIQGKERPFGVLGAHTIRKRAFTKDDINFLQAVANVVGLAVERKQAEEMIEHMAYHDLLTDLPNRRLFRDRLEQAMAHARRDRRIVAVLYADLDRFKHINDTLGHDIGDLLLQAVARRMTDSVRGADTVARVGGDEFTIILADLARAQDAGHVARKLLRQLSKPFLLRGHEILTSACIGISVYPVNGESAEVLLVRADMALRGARGKRRNNYQFFAAERQADVS